MTNTEKQLADLIKRNKELEASNKHLEDQLKVLQTLEKIDKKHKEKAKRTMRESQDALEESLKFLSGITLNESSDYYNDLEEDADTKIKLYYKEPNDNKEKWKICQDARTAMSFEKKLKDDKCVLTARAFVKGSKEGRKVAVEMCGKGHKNMDEMSKKKTFREFKEYIKEN
jgi:hypothetical protein